MDGSGTMERALTLQGLLCIALAGALALGQWLWPSSDLESAVGAVDERAAWSEAAADDEAAPAMARRAIRDAGGCPG